MLPSFLRRLALGQWDEPDEASMRLARHIRDTTASAGRKSPSRLRRFGLCLCGGAPKLRQPMPIFKKGDHS